MRKPQGIAGEPVFYVENLLIGRTKRHAGEAPFPVTVTLRVDRVRERRQTVEHKLIESFLDFGVNSSIWMRENPLLNAISNRPGVPHNITHPVHPFTHERLSELRELAQHHHNSLKAQCAHQWAPLGPREARPEPCEETGYKYGDEWLVEPLPEDFLTRLRAVFEGCDPQHIYDSGEEA